MLKDEFLKCISHRQNRRGIESFSFFGLSQVITLGLSEQCVHDGNMQLHPLKLLVNQACKMKKPTISNFPMYKI
jgi:hypothetical protein